MRLFEPDYKWKKSAERDARSGRSLCLIRLSNLADKEVTAAIAAYETYGWCLDRLSATEFLPHQESAEPGTRPRPVKPVVTYHVLFRKSHH